MLEDEDNVNSGSLAVEGRRSSQATANFEARFWATGATPSDLVANAKGPGTKDVPETRD